jgi:hypothetical protein
MESTNNSFRFNILDGLRTSKLERARECSELTIPSILPPLGWTEQQSLPQPYSSTASKGVTAMSSRMLSALFPLNDSPFFKFTLSSGENADQEVTTYLETLSHQVYTKISAANLRETAYQVIQHLITVGDVLLIMDDDFTFRIIRLDNYTCRRDVYGNPLELIFIEYQALEEEVNSSSTASTSSLSMDEKKGYKKIYVRVLKEEEAWSVEKQDSDGNVIDKGEYKVSPYIPLLWTRVPGENYGRSHVEDIIGDIKTLEAFTEGLINGVAASSVFWMGVDPAGMTEIDDIAGSQSGNWVPARANEVHTISPANTMSPQIQSTQQGVEILRREIGKAFLMDSASMPTGDRVTATAVRMIGQELEHVLGGAFSALAREMMKPIVERSMFLLMSTGDIDERLKEMFTTDGLLDISIVTGLQALSRDTDLQKLMQMGEMVRNLPEQAAASFRWDAYGKALITSLGFSPDEWVKAEEEVQQEMVAQQQQQMDMQTRQQQQLMGQQAAMQAAQQQASQEMQQLA